MALKPLCLLWVRWKAVRGLKAEKWYDLTVEAVWKIDQRGGRATSVAVLVISQERLWWLREKKGGVWRTDEKYSESEYILDDWTKQNCWWLRDEATWEGRSCGSSTPKWAAGSRSNIRWPTNDNHLRQTDKSVPSSFSRSLCELKDSEDTIQGRS